MSFVNFESFAESMPLSQVVQELRNRGLNTAAPDRELRAELARVIFRENNVPFAPLKPGLDQEVFSPADTVKDLGPSQVQGGNSAPGRPPAESTRLNGDFRLTGAIPKRTEHQSFITAGDAAPRQSHQLGVSLPTSFRPVHLGISNFDLRPNMMQNNQAPFSARPEDYDEDLDSLIGDLPGPEERYVAGRNRPQVARNRRLNAPRLRPVRAPFDFQQAPEFHRPGNLHFAGEERFPDQEDLEYVAENDSQRQRRLSTAFDSVRKLNIHFSGSPN